MYFSSSLICKFTNYSHIFYTHHMDSNDSFVLYKLVKLFLKGSEMHFICTCISTYANILKAIFSKQWFPRFQQNDFTILCFFLFFFFVFRYSFHGTIIFSLLSKRFRYLLFFYLHFETLFLKKEEQMYNKYNCVSRFNTIVSLTII